MRKFLLATAAVAIGTAALTSTASAYEVTFQTANTNGKSFNAAPDGTFAAATVGSAISAAFTYTGPLSLQVGPPQNSGSGGDINGVFFGAGTISNYSGSGTLGSPANANFTSPSSFLASSGSASGFQYGSLLTFNLGVLAAGTVLTIDHDDGASVYQGGARVGTTIAGPTSEVIDTVKLSNTGAVTLYYSRENGAPSVLKVAVPEPASLALLGAGLAGVGFVRRRRA